MLAVKPQHLSDVCAAFDLAAGRKFLAHPRTCISILAGSTRDGISHQFRRAVYSADIRVIRVMPNTPAGVGKGIAAICAGATVDEAHLTFARTLLSATSTLIDLDESMFDAFTAIAGSGPAYLFYLVEAMQRGAEAVGFDSATARTLAERTVVGSAHLLESSDSSAQELRTAVTSKGGTTQAATTEMDNHDVMQTVADAIVKARDRGRELGQASGKE